MDICSRVFLLQGFSVEGQENIQEILSKQLLLCQFLVGMSVVRPGIVCYFLCTDMNVMLLGIVCITRWGHDCSCSLDTYLYSVMRYIVVMNMQCVVFRHI